MEYLVAVVLVVAFGLFVKSRINKKREATGTDGTGAGGRPGGNTSK